MKTSAYMVTEEEKLILIDCGLTDIESKVYLTLLRLGPSTAYKVSKEASVHKANCYEALKNLLEKGLVSTISRDKHAVYQTTNPESIINILKRKEDAVRSILPRLKIMEGMISEKSEATILKGIKSIMNLLYSLLEYKQPIYIYGIPEIAPRLLKPYIMDFHKERTKRRIQMNHIYSYYAQDRIKILNKLPYTKAKHLPKSVVSSTATLICGPEVHLHILYETGASKTIRIIDKDIADSYRSYFFFLWKIAK